MSALISKECEHITNEIREVTNMTEKKKKKPAKKKREEEY